MPWPNTSWNIPRKPAKLLPKPHSSITRLNENPANQGHHDLLIAEIPFREAEAKIGGKITSPDNTDE